MLLLPLFALSAGELDPRLQKLRDQWRKHPSQTVSRLVAGETFVAPTRMGHGPAEEARVPATLSIRGTEVLDALGIPYTRVTPTIVTAEVPLSALDALERAPSILLVELAHRKRPQKRNDVNMAKLNVNIPYAAGYTGANVLVGIVDSGIDVHHSAFRVGGTASGESRILRLWDQTAAHVPFSIGAFSSTKGRLWTAAEITAGQCSQVDTDGHGTHVAGSVAGFDAAFPARHGAAKGANLLFAKTTYNNTDIQNAIVWMLEQAKALGKPLVVNLSLGSQYGPHDGTDLDTKALDDLIAASKGQLIVVRSGGNDADGALHDSGTVSPSGLSIPLTVSTYTTSSTEDDLAAMNFYVDATAAVSVRIKDSAGNVSPWFAPSTTGYGGAMLDGTGYYVKNNSAPEPYNPAIKRIYIDLGEQDGVNDTRHIRTGTHTLEFRTDTGSTRIDGWIYYTGPDSHEIPVTFTSPDPDMTLGNDACGRNVITVAAYTSRKWWPSSEGPTYSFRGSSLDHQIASFSSIGPTRDNRQKPDVTAGGCAVLSAKSSATTVQAWLLPAEGGSTYRMMQGTSMSSPTVAGAVALLKERFPAWTFEDMITYFKSNSQGTPLHTTPGTWNKSWGWGVIDLLNTGQAVSLAIAPSGTVQAQPGATVAFKATVTGMTNNAVAWSVTPGGGSITPSTTAGNGVAIATYTAPASAGSYTVTATSVEDATRKASTTVVVVDTSVITVSVSPSSKTLQPGGTHTFSATAQGAPSPGTFTWSASGGTIQTSTGAYTAPTAPGTYTITALSSWGPSGTATVHVKTLDLNGDGAIDTLDVLQLTKRWNSTDALDLAKADLNGDGRIDDTDLDLLKSAL